MRRAIAILCGLSSACALFADLDGFSKDVIVIEAGPSDAQVASDSSDAFVSDRGGDARAPCTATFCDDFDTQPLGFDWESRFQGGGTRTFDTANYRSAPRSILFASEGFVTTSFEAKQLRPYTANTKLTLEADVRIESTAPGTGATFLGFEGARASDGVAFQLYFRFEADSATATIVEDIDTQPRAYVRHDVLRWPQVGAWSRVKMTLSRPSGDATFLAVEVDGKEALAQVELTHRMRFADPIRTWIGMSFVTPPTAGWRVQTDDVAITVE
jgi:hypothetical protein